MKVLRVRKKPVEVEAVLFTSETKDQVFNWVTCNRYPTFNTKTGEPSLKIQTLNGDVVVSVGEYVIRGVNGEYYPCDPDIFDKTYDVLEG